MDCKKRGTRFARQETLAIRRYKVCLYLLWTSLKQGISQFLNMSVIRNWVFAFFSTGVKSVAFFFSAISTQGPTSTSNKKRNDDNNDGNGGESDNDSVTQSQVSGSSSQTWIANHPSIVNKKLRPSVSYWIAMITPNGAPANPITVHRALLECGVDATAKQVQHIST